jgi:hypothetical protein
MPEIKPVVTVRIEHGPVKLIHRHAWNSFWAKLIEETRIEGEAKKIK